MNTALTLYCRSSFGQFVLPKTVKMLKKPHQQIFVLFNCLTNFKLNEIKALYIVFWYFISHVHRNNAEK